ncbi:MAG: phosphate ABC transporter ATP-binding protein [Clostridiales Family XIII bacterium]|jgi:phosphate transport system ATP-binding protein|nr:phosphate ABC transporter ATP-binding protein [Clostridiales Family XIII bacterium]
MDNTSKNIAIRIKNVTCSYGGKPAVRNASLDVPQNSICAFIGPSGCGKTTLLRSVNRLNDLTEGFALSGSIEINGENIYGNDAASHVEALRRNIGMIFQQPNPLPTGILKNMYMPIKAHYTGEKKYFYEKAVEKLKTAGLYDEIEHRLDRTALSLSGGQQQRLCIARALMLEPKIMLFDEPCSALDPIATYKIEDMLLELKKERTMIIVTHNMEQARRVSDYTAFFYQGEIVEAGRTNDVFFNPKTELLDQYIRGRFS